MNSGTIELTPVRWARVEELFDRAVGLPPSERENFLRASCADDAELCDYVVSLLQIDESAPNDLDNTVVDALQSAISQAIGRDESIAGTMLGPYRIAAELGSGGMGIVYLAERADDQFEQQVAIKLGRHRLVDQLSQQRLRGERQILANLDHPNIARLLDGGTADDGTPYIVMEYIDGVRIDTYCDRNRLGIDQRLDLFDAICGAVHYAHQNLVVHRDIKPANILVTEDGTPKLLDFGIAKLIDAQGTATDGLTREGVVVMTPENAAPEQVLGRAITTATDTYALGLLLYSLLTGMTAYKVNDRPPAEIARIICRTLPEVPSSRIGAGLQRARREEDRQAIERIEECCANRGLSPDRLQARLRGDLDTIVLSALRKEPERRYRSVSQFAEDLRLHRASLPIVARGDAWSYRAGKFLRRHYAGAAMSALLVSILLAFAVLTSFQNKRIAAERDVARQVSTFLEEIFRSPDPERARGADVTAREILETGAARLNRDLGEQPEVRAALLATIGRVYMNLGEYEQSAALLEESLAIRREALDADDPGVAEGKIALASTLIQRAEYPRAERLLREALEQNRASFGAQSIEVAITRFRLAELYLATGDLDQAGRFASGSVDAYSLYEEENAIDLANAKNLLGRIMLLNGDLDATESLLREAIDIVRRNGGSDHPLMAYYLQNLGVLLQSRGDLDGAETTLAQAIEATRRILGEEHDLLATTLVIQGGLLHDKGDLFAAESALRDALSIHRRAYGPDHPFVGYDMTSLGMLLHDKGDLAAAEDMLREALRVFSLSLGDEHQYVASALTALGSVLTAAGGLAEAETLLERAVATRRKDYPATHPLVAATNTEYGNVLVSLGRFADAEPLLLSSHQVLGDQENSRRARRARAALLRLYTDWGKPALARDFTYEQRVEPVQ